MISKQQLHDQVLNGLTQLQLGAEEKYQGIQPKQIDALHAAYLTGMSQTLKFLIGNDGGVSLYEMSYVVDELAKKLGFGRLN